MKKHIHLIIVGTVLLLFAGCEFGLDPEATAPGPEEFVDIFDTSYEIELQGSVDEASGLSASALFGGSQLSASATAAAGHLGEDGIPAGSSVTVEDYPEPGLNSRIEVDEDDGLLEITVISFPRDGFEESFIVERTVEEYYVVDVDGDGVFDPDEVGMITHPDLEAGEYNWANLYREEFVDYFKDGSERVQFIINSQAADADLGFAPFDVNGSMEFPTGTYAPQSSDEASWSSVVMYRHELEETFNFWFYNDRVDDPITVGIRYYTEHDGDDGTTVGTTYALEVILGEIDDSVETLAENVIRKEVVFDENGVAVSRRARMEMVIENKLDGEGMVFRKNGKDLSRLPARAQQAQLRQVEQSATMQSNADWGDIEIRLR